MLIYAQNSFNRNARLSLLPNQRTTWKYRGQITPTNDLFRLAIHFTEVQSDRIRGNASLWNDEERIYEMENVGIGVTSDK